MARMPEAEVDIDVGLVAAATHDRPGPGADERSVATELAVAWMVLPAQDRHVLRGAAGEARPVDDATWRRARAWALALAIAYLTGSDDNPAMGSIGRRALAAALRAD
jgi:hypothetical protein